MAAAPLLWCRVAAAACRLAQAIFLPHELRIQCFVDDPAMAVYGTLEQREWLLGTLLLFWSLLGFKFNWRKGARGQEVPWIGANVKVEVRPYGVQARSLPGVLVTLSPAKLKELRDPSRTSTAARA